MSETLGLKNVNMMSKEMYSNIADEDIKRDELYAISGSGFGFPSDRYDDLELGASNTEYTAPANGWVCIAKVGGSSNAYVHLTNMGNGLGLIVHVPASGNVCKCFIPVKKGDVFKVEYTASGTHTFRFIYSEGE